MNELALDSVQRQQALKLLVSTFKQKARKKLSQSKRGIFSGKLLESINGRVELDDDEYHFFLDMEEYGQFIDEGVNGTERNVGSRFSFKNKKPPLSAIKPWAKAKNLNPYAVQNSIFKKGIKGIHFFENVIDEEVGKLADYIAEVTANNILNDFASDD